MFRLGDIEVSVISAGQVMVDSGGPFGLVPYVLWQKHQPLHDGHYLPMSLNSMLIKTGGKNIIVDVGHGDKLTEKMREIFQLTYPYGTLQEGLGRVGLGVEDIDMVIDTHLHGDHAGGNTTYDADGLVVATFPNAEYVVQRREFEDAIQPNERTGATYLPVNYQSLYEIGQLRLLDGDTELAPGVRGIVTPGHTPAHMSVHVTDSDQHILFVCDLASYAVHFAKLGWMTAYDVEPLVTLETKRKWQTWALENDAILIFPHDTTMIAGRLTEDEKGRPYIHPLTAQDGAVYV